METPTGLLTLKNRGLWFTVLKMIQWNNMILKKKKPLIIKGLEQVRGIEPPSQAWEACILPMNYTCEQRYYIPSKKKNQELSEKTYAKGAGLGIALWKTVDNLSKKTYTHKK